MSAKRTAVWQSWIVALSSRIVAAVATLLVAAVGGAAAGCGTDEPRAPAGDLRIATGSSTGVYYLYGQAIAAVVRTRLPQLRPEVLATAASRQNLDMVTGGTAEIGFAQADTADESIRRGAQVAALARVYDDYLHLVVRDAGPIGKLADLRGKRVSIGAEGSGTIGTVTRLLAVEKLDPMTSTDVTAVRYNLDDSARALTEGTIDAFFFSGGLPVNAIQTLRAHTQIRLVDLGGHATELRRRHGQFYAEHTVPASIYGMPAAVSTIGIPNYLVVSSERMSAATGYALTRALFEERATLAEMHPAAARLNVREAINTYPLVLHPGAARWYQQNKR